LLRHDLDSLEAAQAHWVAEQSEIQHAEAQAERQRAAVAEARLNLSYTRIYAVRAGTVANRTVQVGNYVEPGETLFSAVPPEVYVIANFKETQLTHMHPGQPATVRVGRGVRDNQATASLVEAHVPAEHCGRWFGIARISQRPLGGRLRSGWVI
jgi:multidrug resistance efflux pump